MSANPNYQIFRPDLSAAGQMDIPAQFTYFRMVRAFNPTTGVTDLDAIVFVQPRRSGGDEIPMQINGLVQLPAGTDFVRIRWDAQPGTTVWLFMSDQARDGGVDVEAPPTKQIVTTAIGSVVTVAAVTVGVVAVLVAAANGLRQKLNIQNLGAADIYIGPAGVTTATGTKVFAGGGSYEIEGTTAALYAISASAGNDVRVLEEA